MAELHSAPLSDLLAALDIKISDGTEDIKRFTVFSEVGAAPLAQLSFVKVERFIAAYAMATESARIEIDEVTRINFQTNNFSPEYLQHQQGRLSSDDRCILRLSIDKERLVQEVLGADAVTTNKFFFFSSLLERKISEDLVNFEESVWGDAIEYRRILVGDTDIQRGSEAFEIRGTSRGAIPSPQAISAETVESIRMMQNGRMESVSLEYPWVRKLTPIQIQLDGDSTGSRLEEFFSSMHIRLCLLHLCDRARRRDTGIGPPEIQAEFGLVRLFIPETGLIMDPMVLKANEYFASLVSWCYQSRDGGAARHWATERLKLSRVRIALELEPYLESDRSQQLIRGIGNIWASMESHWRAFIEDRLSKYIDEEHKLESIASDVVRSAGEKTVALTKGLTDTMLAAVAAVIGSAIAAAFRTPFDQDLFKALVLSYAGYMLIFPVAYGISSQVKQYRSFKKSFDHDKSHFIDLLGQSRVDDIVGDRDTAPDGTYWRTFRWTLFGFGVAIAAAVVAAFAIPAIVC